MIKIRNYVYLFYLYLNWIFYFILYYFIHMRIILLIRYCLNLKYKTFQSLLHGLARTLKLKQRRWFLAFRLTFSVGENFNLLPEKSIFPLVKNAWQYRKIRYTRSTSQILINIINTGFALSLKKVITVNHWAL